MRTTRPRGKSTIAISPGAVSGMRVSFLLRGSLLFFPLCVVCAAHSDSHNTTKPAADPGEGGVVGVAEPPVAMEPADDEPRGLPTTGQDVGGDSGEEEEGVWNVAHKKYQEFQQTCGDILDPGKDHQGNQLYSMYCATCIPYQAQHAIAKI